MKIIRQIIDRASPMKVITLNKIAAAGGADLGLRSCMEELTKNH